MIIYFSQFLQILLLLALHLFHHARRQGSCRPLGGAKRIILTINGYSIPQNSLMLQLFNNYDMFVKKNIILKKKLLGVIL